MVTALMLVGVLVVGTGLAWAIVYGGSVRSHPLEEDHEYALFLERARRREADAGQSAGGAMPALPAREPGPRDPTLGPTCASASIATTRARRGSNGGR